MPPLPTIADVYRVTLNWGTAHGITPRNVLHFSAPGLTDADIATAFDANASDDMWKCIQQDWAFTSLDILKLDGTSATTTHAVSAQGSLQSGDWATPVAGVMSLRTPARGSAGRGRVFLGPVAEVQLTSGLLISTAAIGTAWEAFRVGMQAAGTALVVASYVHVTSHPVTNLHMSNIPGVVRRRQDQLR